MFVYVSVYLCVGVCVRVLIQYVVRLYAKPHVRYITCDICHQHLMDVYLHASLR